MSYFAVLVLTTLVFLTVLTVVGFVLKIVIPLMVWVADVSDLFGGVVMVVVTILGVGTIGWLVVRAIEELHTLGLR